MLYGKLERDLQANRFEYFAQFFKGYMGVMPVLTAALAPVITLLRTVPVFEVQRKELAVYSGLFGFLLVAYVFYGRDFFRQEGQPDVTPCLTRRKGHTRVSLSSAVAVCLVMIFQNDPLSCTARELHSGNSLSFSARGGEMDISLTR